MITSNKKSNFNDTDQVYYLVTNNHIHYRKNGFTAHSSHIIKKKNGLYINKATGEVIPNPKKSDLKIQNQQSLIRSYRNLFYTIENYVDTFKNSVTITLDYEKPQTNLDSLSHDFDCFIKRLKRYIKKVYPTYHYEYIRINEPHENLFEGKPKWHIHLIILGIAFIPIEDIRNLWKQEGAYIKSYTNRNGESAAKYFCGFLNAPEHTKSKNELDIKRSSKKRRLKYYTSGTDLFSTSRGIKTPTFRRGTYGKIKKKYPGETLNEGSKTIVIDGKIVNRFDYMNQKLIK